MSKPKTHYAIVLDKSGSMDKRKQEALSYYNEQVQQLKIDAEDQEILCSLFTFNKHVTEHLFEQPVNELQEASDEHYNPKGGTAMRDAIAHVISRFRATTDVDDKNAAYCLLIITDGESINDEMYPHYDNSAINRFKKLVKELEDTGRWTFTFLGCSKEYLCQLSEQTGISISNMAQFSTEKPEDFAFAAKATARRTHQYLRNRARGGFSNSNYMSDTSDVACFVPEQTVITKQVNDKNLYIAKDCTPQIGSVSSNSIN